MEGAKTEVSPVEKQQESSRKRRRRESTITYFRKLKEKKKAKKVKRDEAYTAKVQLSLQTKSTSTTECLGLWDVQDLFLCPLLGKSLNVPDWLKLPSLSNVLRAVVVLISAVGKQLYEENKDCFPNLSGLFEVSFPTKAVGSKKTVVLPHETLLTLKYRSFISGLIFSDDEGEEEYGNREPGEQGQETPVNGTVPGREHYVLTRQDLVMNGFPLPNDKGEVQKGYVELGECTGEDRPVSEAPMFAIDCEMCQSKVGKELARVSVVDESLELLYDSYVKPGRKIVDYLTRYSGVTAETLERVTTNRKDVQHKLRTMLQRDVILVGHSLEYDLRALKVHHDRVIDTAVSYAATTNAKPALRDLAHRLLGKAIQQGDGGHSPIEDARTSMELAQLKIQKGPEFGYKKQLFDNLDRKKIEASLLDSPGIVGHHSSAGCHAIPCTSDEEVVSKIGRQMETSAFTWAHLHGVERALKGRSDGTEETCGEDLKEVLRQLDAHVSEIVGKVPPDCLVLVVCGSGDISTVKTLRRKSRKGPSSKEEFLDFVERAKQGICFVKRT